jgi:hypothetical protein
MSEKEEGIHKVSREPCGCVRKPEQDSNRGAEIIKRAVLSAEDRMRLIIVNHTTGSYLSTCYMHLQQAGYSVLYFCHMYNEIVTKRKLPYYWSAGCLTCIAVIGLQCRPESHFYVTEGKCEIGCIWEVSLDIRQCKSVCIRMRCTGKREVP